MYKRQVRGASMVGVGLGLLSVSVMLVLWLTDSWLAPLLLLSLIHISEPTRPY